MLERNPAQAWTTAPVHEPPADAACGGTIYGDEDHTADNDYDNTGTSGNAAYVYVDGTNGKKRDSTAGPGAGGNMDSAQGGEAGGWDE